MIIINLLISKASSVLSPYKDTFGSAGILCFEQKLFYE